MRPITSSSISTRSTKLNPLWDQLLPLPYPQDLQNLIHYATNSSIPVSPVLRPLHCSTLYTSFLLILLSPVFKHFLASLFYVSLALASYSLFLILCCSPTNLSEPSLLLLRNVGILHIYSVVTPVSYTHLDVYKRQLLDCARLTIRYFL